MGNLSWRRNLGAPAWLRSFKQQGWVLFRCNRERWEPARRTVGWRPLWRGYDRRRLVHCWRKRLITGRKQYRQTRQRNTCKKRNEARNSEWIDMHARGQATFSRKLGKANSITIKSRKAGRVSIAGDGKMCREGSVTENQGLHRCSRSRRTMRSRSSGRSHFLKPPDDLRRHLHLIYDRRSSRRYTNSLGLLARVG